MSDDKKHNRPVFQVIENTPEASSNQDDDINLGANDEAVALKVSQLEEEHRDLDQAILTMEERMPYDRLTLQRMKKRKLAIKDKITKLKEAVHPDIIA